MNEMKRTMKILLDFHGNIVFCLLTVPALVWGDLLLSTVTKVLVSSISLTIDQYLAFTSYCVFIRQNVVEMFPLSCYQGEQ